MKVTSVRQDLTDWQQLVFYCILVKQQVPKYFLLFFFSKTGMKVGEFGDSFGLNGVSEYLYPKYGWKLVIITIIIVVITTTITSFIPTRRIAKLKPTDALRGRFTDVKKSGRKKHV